MSLRPLLLSFLGAALAALGPGCNSSEPSEAKVGPFEPKVEWTHLTCDPLVPTQCGFPFPSNVWTVDAADTPTGRRVQIDDDALPVALSGQKSSAAPWAKSDGFGAGTGILTHLPGATLEGLPSLTTLPRSLEADSPTVILDTETGQRVPHFAELDMSRADPDKVTFILRPVVPLTDARRYIVAIRKVRGETGELAPTPAFKALRDSVASSEPSVDARRGLYEDIFQRLAGSGVARDSLQLAWDFTTASRENVTGWLLHMRDEALAQAGEGGPAYVIDTVDENWEPELIAYRISGRMTVPLYLDKPEPGASLVFGPDGMPDPNPARPTYEVPFKVIIPKSALTKPAPLLQYGHGLLGTRDQIEAANFRKLISEKNYVIFALDLVGMSDDDSGHIANVLSSGQLQGISTMFDRMHQGMLNWLLAMRMMSRGFAKDPRFGAYIDPTQRYYHGISQGGIAGGVYMSASTDVERGVLSVMGQPYGFLLNRSVDFAPFFLVLRGTYPDTRDQQLVLALTQMLWDRVEPNGWTKYLGGGLPGTPAHTVLMSAALGDHQVTTFGAHVMARAVGAKHLDTGLRDVFGLEKVPETQGGSVYVEYDFGLPDEPLCNVPMSHCEDPHGMIRKLQASDDQLDTFLRTGQGKSFCPGGACRFPEQSGCTGGTYADLCAP
ncbi:MAG: hypothetical protein KF764_30070 [Labilithrix sp.]|nr:hypothetical protein [Labilithrix sp.]